MAIKNYTTKISAMKTINEIQQILIKHKAKAILIEYGDTGSATALSFKIDTKYETLGVKLPARQVNVLKILKNQKNMNTSIKATNEQAEKVAWRNLKDWLDAQMALIETEMVNIDEVFLPYIINESGQTLYEVFTENKLLLKGK